MSGYRQRGPVRSEENESKIDTGLLGGGFPPGPINTETYSKLAYTNIINDDVRFTTDMRLLELAKSIPLKPKRDCAVFYAEDEGSSRATRFIRDHQDYTRLDELVPAAGPEGRLLWNCLSQTRRPWSDKEEVWWELSYRLAREASGVVNVFGPPRLTTDRPLEESRHTPVTNAFVNTVFEKVELPELEQNENVTKIFYNGEPFD